MSQKQHWISLIKAHLLLLLCLQSPDLGRCQGSKSTPLDLTLRGVTDVTKSPTVTGPASLTGDIGDTERSSALATSTGSPDFTTVDIQPTPSSIFHRDNDSFSDLAGETTPVLPSLHAGSTVLPPLHTVTLQPSLDKSEHFSSVSESLQRSITPYLTTSTFSHHGTEVTVTVTTSLSITSSSSESLAPTSSFHIDSDSSSTAVVTTSSAHSSTSSLHISSTHSDSSTSTSSIPVFSSSFPANISHPSTTVSLPHGTSSGGTTPVGILPNTTKVPATNSSNTAGEEDRLHRRHDDNALTTPAVIGIGFGAAAAALVITGVVLLLLKRKAYRRNKHDSSNFWDDNVTLSYINSHAEFPKDLDAEMMSLDDDSFLNSLDSMTFANLWAADTAKHTNF